METPEYGFVVIACEEGGWAIKFPELSGCMTQADSWEEIGTQARDALETWLDGMEQVPNPIKDHEPIDRW